jgi:hypothetical protein
MVTDTNEQRVSFMSFQIHANDRDGMKPNIEGISSKITQIRRLKRDQLDSCQERYVNDLPEGIGSVELNHSMNRR